MEIKLKNAINTFENPLRAYFLGKLFEYAYNNELNEERDLDDEDERRLKHQSEYSDNSFTPRKNNTYIYESFDEKNSILLYPNSEDSDRLHRVYKLIEMQNENLDDSNISNDIDMNNFKKGINFSDRKKIIIILILIMNYHQFKKKIIIKLKIKMIL